MPSFDLVIFDFDGTLVDSAAGIAACMRAAFDFYGLEPPLEAQVRARVGLTLEETIRQLASRADVAAVAARYRELHDTVAAPAVTLFAGADGVLRALADAGTHAVVVSHKARRGLRHLLDQFGITDRFNLILGADDVTAHKPDAALYQRHIEPVVNAFRPQATDRDHIPRDRVLVVGDTATDLEFARNIGARSCWAAYGYGDQGRCSALSPDFTIADISALRPICGC